MATRSTPRSSCGCCKDKDLLVKKGASWELREGAEVPFPDSVQALIAARLDTLSADTKSMLADAAVIGKVFWAGAIAQMGERDLTDGHRHAPGTLAQGARASRPPFLDRGRGRVRVLARARSRRRLRAAAPEPRGPRATSPRRAGSSRRPPSASRTSPTSSPTTTPRRWSSRGPPGRPSRPPSSRHRP